MFNLPQSYFDHPELLDTSWQKGQTMLAVCNTKTIRYVTGYLQKTLYTTGQHEDDDRRKEFSLMSRGLGAAYMTPARIEYYKRKLNPYLIVHNGDKIHLPRYYKDKMFTSAELQVLKKKAELFSLDNPQFKNEKHRWDRVKDLFQKAEKRQMLQRQKL